MCIDVSSLGLIHFSLFCFIFKEDHRSDSPWAGMSLEKIFIWSQKPLTFDIIPLTTLISNRTDLATKSQKTLWWSTLTHYSAQAFLTSSHESNLPLSSMKWLRNNRSNAASSSRKSSSLQTIDWFSNFIFINNYLNCSTTRQCAWSLLGGFRSLNNPLSLPSLNQTTTLSSTGLPFTTWKNVLPESKWQLVPVQQKETRLFLLSNVNWSSISTTDYIHIKRNSIPFRYLWSISWIPQRVMSSGQSWGKDSSCMTALRIRGIQALMHGSHFSAGIEENSASTQ